MTDHENDLKVIFDRSYPILIRRLPNCCQALMEACWTTWKRICKDSRQLWISMCQRSWRGGERTCWWAWTPWRSWSFWSILFHVVQHASMSAWQQFKSHPTKIRKMTSTFVFRFFKVCLMLAQMRFGWLYGNQDFGFPVGIRDFGSFGILKP